MRGFGNPLALHLRVAVELFSKFRSSGFITNFSATLFTVDVVAGVDVGGCGTSERCSKKSTKKA